MSHYTAQILWQRDGQDFLGDRYSRRHLINSVTTDVRCEPVYSNA